MTPVAFFDDDKSKWRSRIHDIPVIGPPEALRDSNLNLQLEEVIIAMPSAPASGLEKLVKVLQQSHLKVTTVPSMDQLATGKVKVSQIAECGNSGSSRASSGEARDGKILNKFSPIASWPSRARAAASGANYAGRSRFLIPSVCC